MSAEVKNMDPKLFDQTLTSALAAIGAAAAAWFLGTFRKVDRKAMDDAIKTAIETATKPMEREMSDLRDRARQWDVRAEKFATRESIQELKIEMERSLGKIDRALEDISKQILHILTSK